MESWIGYVSQLCREQIGAGDKIRELSASVLHFNHKNR